jgi:hypothetical protein
MLQGGVEFGLQLGNLLFEFLVFGEEFSHHRLERGDIGWQRWIGRSRGGIHALSNTASQLR